jgi:hypothetical protein
MARSFKKHFINETVVCKAISIRSYILLHTSPPCCKALLEIIFCVLQVALAPFPYASGVFFKFTTHFAHSWLDFPHQA